MHSGVVGCGLVLDISLKFMVTSPCWPSNAFDLGSTPYLELVGEWKLWAPIRREGKFGGLETGLICEMERSGDQKHWHGQWEMSTSLHPHDSRHAQ